jgi:hypothetical protein
MLPSTGEKAINGMQDAVILANRLYDILPTSFETIKAALSDYRDERFGNVKSQYSNTHMSARLQFSHVRLLLVFSLFSSLARTKSDQSPFNNNSFLLYIMN